MYTTREGRFRGNPVIEVLDDGEPFGADLPTMEHFAFGLRKARLILAFMDEIEGFAGSDGRVPSVTAEIRRDVSQLGSCTCEKETEFEAFGKTIERPFLQLSGPGNLGIGFGVTKAGALHDVEDDIRTFVSKHG